MIRIEGTTIKLTRGDSAVINVELVSRDGDEVIAYHPVEGDSIRFAMKRDRLTVDRGEFVDRLPLIKKNVDIDFENETCTLFLDPQDTKPFPFGVYAYDLEITMANGDVCTFVADARLELLREVD